MDSSSEHSAHPSDSRAAWRRTLQALTIAVDEPSVDLDAHLATVLDHLVAAIPSTLALTLSVTVDDYELSLTAEVPSVGGTESAIGSSLLVPLVGATSGDSTSARLLVVASSPGALVDLAADSAYFLGIDLTGLELDRHLDAGRPENSRHDIDDGTPDSARATPFEDQAMINYAIGILYDRNPEHTLTTARAALVKQSERARISVVDAARRIVASTTTPLEYPR